MENILVAVLQDVYQDVACNRACLCRIELGKLFHQFPCFYFSLRLFQLLFKLAKVVSFGKIKQGGGVGGLDNVILVVDTLFHLG